MKFPLKKVLTFFILPFFLNTSYTQETNQYKKQGDSLYQIVNYYYGLQKIDSTIFYLNKAAQSYKKAESWEDYVNSLNSQTNLYYYTKMYDDYKKTAFKANSEAQKNLPSNNPTSITSLSNLSTSYSIFGNYDKAIKYSTKALKLKIENNLPINEITVSYINLATFYKYIGENQKSINFYKKGLDLINTATARQVEITSTIYQGIGLVFSSINQIDSALVYLKKEEELLFSNLQNTLLKKNRIDNFINFAELYNKKGDNQKSQGYINKALALSPKINRQIKIQEALGKFALSNNKYEEAKTFFLEAERLAEKSQKRITPPIKSRRLLELCKSYEKTGNYDKALNNYQIALEILATNFKSNDTHENPKPSQIHSPIDGLNILHRKADILNSKASEVNNIKAAYETFIVAIDLIRQIRQGIQTSESKKTLAIKTLPIYEGAIQSTLALYQKTKDSKYKEAAFKLAESNKALLLLESINDQTAKGFAGIPDSLLEKEKDLKSELAFYKKQLLKNNTNAKNIDNKIFELQQTLDYLTSNFEKNYPRYFELKYQNEPINLKTIQEDLAKNNSALIEYFVGEKAIYVFVVSKDNIDIEIIDEPKIVNTAIAQLRPILNQPPGSMDPKQEFAQFTKAAYDLYSILVSPALNKLPKSIQHLTIVSDDQLNYLPFDILLSEKANLNLPGYSLDHLQYLMKDYTINYHYSATLLHKSQTRKKQNYTKNFIGFAPQFKDSEYMASRSCTSDELYSLKCSNDEVQSISSLLDGESRLADQATKSVFENEASAYRIIHLATHACIDENNSNLNKIFLTDDYLSNFDLYNLKLNTELAVLSACNTGSGELIKGEGVMNLARGFINAGCSSTLMSMWSVDDCATSDIMYRFYEGLNLGLKKDQALQSAKLSYLNETSKTKMHPYYWAAFVPFGDMEAIEFEQKSNWLFYLIPFGLLLLGFYFFGDKKYKE